jgi:hypothetical protein
MALKYGRLPDALQKQQELQKLLRRRQPESGAVLLGGFKPQGPNATFFLLQPFPMIGGPGRISRIPQTAANIVWRDSIQSIALRARFIAACLQSGSGPTRPASTRATRHLRVFADCGRVDEYVRSGAPGGSEPLGLNFLECVLQPV